jgi:hypothetical protein
MTSTERYKIAIWEADRRMQIKQIANAIDNLQNGNLTQARKVAKGLSWSDIFDGAPWAGNWSDKKSAACADYLTKRIDFRTYCEAIR